MRFYLDCINGVYDGKNVGKWNGFACPTFSKDEAIHLMHSINKQQIGLTITFDKKKKAFTSYDKNADETEVFEMQDGQYPIGAFSWCWMEV